MDDRLPSQQIVCMTALEIKDGVDRARARGVDCDYPILFEIDGHYYSFATCVAECSAHTAQERLMPIRPENRARYPKNWKEIRLQILGRADHRCEWPGCGIQNGDTNPRTGSRVVLTIAHLDHQPENCDFGNLMAMCQEHHLAYDHKHHQQNAYQTRRKGKALGELL